MDKQSISVNPLNAVFSHKRELRPEWMCKHHNATVVDHDYLMFRCYVCHPVGGIIRIVRNPPQEPTSMK